MEQEQVEVCKVNFLFFSPNFLSLQNYPKIFKFFVGFQEKADFLFSLNSAQLLEQQRHS